MDRQSISALAKLFLFLCFQLFSMTVLAQMPVLSPLPRTGSLPQPADDTKFVFVVAGDNRPAKSGCPQPPTPGKIFAAVKALNPPAAFVLWTGDTISGKDPKNKALKDQYKEFLDIAATAGVPVFNAPGNHEMDDSTNQPSNEMKAFYRKYMAGTYGAFDYGNSRFIALDSENVPRTGKPAGVSTAEGQTKPKAPGAITKHQIDLLTKDLHESRKKAHIILFMHHPVEPYDGKDGLDQGSVVALQKLFANYKNISYVVSGHQHLYFNSQGDPKKVVDPPARTDPSQPPFYLVSGGAGAPLKEGDPKKKEPPPPGAFFHYLVFQVNDATITPTLVKVDSCDPCDKTKKCTINVP